MYKKDGKVTAGNTCGLNDAVARVIAISSEKVKELNLKALARVVSYASSAYDTKFIGLDPVRAVKKVLKKLI